MKFSIISSGWNCEQFIPDWYNSLISQKVNWQAFVLDDGSTDKTYRRLENLSDSRLHLFKNPNNKGAAYSRWKLIQQCDGDVLVFLDLDDYILSGSLLSLKKPYKEGKLMTVGSYRMDRGRAKNEFYNRYEIDQNRFLKGTFKCPPLRTFSSQCINFLKEDDFKINRQWIKTCTDVALMFPVLKALRFDDIAVMSKIMYHYRYRPKSQSSYRFDKLPVMNALRIKHGKKN